MKKRTSITAHECESDYKSSRFFEVSESEKDGVLDGHDADRNPETFQGTYSLVHPTRVVVDHKVTQKAQAAPEYNPKYVDLPDEIIMWEQWQQTIHEQKVRFSRKPDSSSLLSGIQLVSERLDTLMGIILHLKSVGNHKDITVLSSGLTRRWESFLRAIDSPQDPLSCNLLMTNFLSWVDSMIRVLNTENPKSLRPRSAPSLPQTNIAGIDKNRMSRWLALNDFLRKNNLVNKENSTPFSSIKVPVDIPMYKRIEYSEPIKDIGDEMMRMLQWYLECASKMFLGRRNESSRLYFIGPILICIGSMLSDVTLETEANVRGEIVRAHGRFDFLIRRGGTRIGLVEAKKCDIDQGITQAVVGCEVVAEIERTDIVYAIVTDSDRWVFLRSTNEEILEDQVILKFTKRGPDASTLRTIAGKIHSLLTET